MDQMAENPAAKLAELAEVRKVDGTGFDWIVKPEDQKEAEVAEKKAEESKDLSYAFMQVGRFKEKLGVVEQKELGYEEMERL